MRFEIGNWYIEKAGEAAPNSTTIPIKMIANSLEPDREGQEMLPQAFNKSTVDKFINHGVIDWHHQSKLGKTNEDRAHAVLGRPTRFEWEIQPTTGRRLPVVYGLLTRNHPIVKNSILPHLEAENPVFSSSVGGRVLNLSKSDSDVEKITAIDWDHIAIAANPYVMSRGSGVSLVKAQAIGSDETHTTEIFMNFADLDSFTKDYAILFKSETELEKALEAGTSTNAGSLTGFQALQPESLEGNYNEEALIESIVDGLSNDTIGASEAGVITFLKANGLPDTKIKTFMPKLTKAITTSLLKS